MNLGEAPSVANFGERWPLACFYASKPLFWLIKWWKFRIWCGGKPICGGAPFYRRFPVKVASSPLCAANSPGLMRVVFLAVSPSCFSGCFARFVTDRVVRLFLADFARLCFLTVSSGRSSVCNSPGYPGCVIKG